MKRLFTTFTAFLLAAGLTACGTQSKSVSVPDIIPAVESDREELPAESDTDVSSEETVASEESHISGTETDTAAFSADDVLPDENGEPLFISENDLDAALREKVCALMDAVAAHDETAYLERFDIETYVRASNLVSGADDLAYKTNHERECQITYFQELSEAFTGDFSGHITDIYFTKWSDNDILASESYELDFSVETDEGCMMIGGWAYLHDGVWSLELRLWAVIDNAYFDYEALMIEEMLAAAQGDQDKYMACVDEDLFIDVSLASLPEGETLSEAEANKVRETLREDIEYICENAFEELSEVLGKDFDGRISEVQYFGKAEGVTIPDGELYGRILVTVMNQDNEYQEVEGYAYSIGDKKGVFLQPD